MVLESVSKLTKLQGQTPQFEMTYMQMSANLEDIMNLPVNANLSDTV